MKQLSLDNMSELPSFSRVGKGCSNYDLVKELEAKSEQERRINSKGRSAVTYQSLADIPPILSSYDVDNGKRSRPIASSPRVAASAARSVAPGGATEADTGLRFERVMRWDEFPSEAKAAKEAKEAAANRDGRRAPPGPGAGGEGDAGKGGREAAMKPKQSKAPTPTSSFKTTVRERDQLAVRMREVGKLAPGVGHYDAQFDTLRPKRDKLAYISDKDRPHAPSFQVEKLARTLPGPRSASAPPVWTPRSSYKVLRELEKIPSNSHAHTVALRRAITPAPDREERGGHGRSRSPAGRSLAASAAPAPPPEVTKQMSVESGGGTEGGGDGAAPAEGGQAQQAGGPGAGGTVQARTISPELSYAHRQEGLDFTLMLPRYKKGSGQPTLTGYQHPVGAYANDAQYDNTDCRRMHMSTPDLSRSGKDHDDLLLRLGHVPPGTNPSPVYVGATDWSKPPGWLKATRPNTGSASLSMDKMLPRRPFSRSEEEPRLELRSHRDGKMWDGGIPDERNPSFPHMPSVNMARSSSSHDVILQKISDCKTERYYYSDRLTNPRTQVIIPFAKGTSRRPLTSDGFTGKPVREVTDVVYDAHDAEMRVVRPRSVTPVDMARSAGRDAVGGPDAESGAGGLHGTNYWQGIGWRTDAVSDVLRYKRLPDLQRSPGRKEPGAGAGAPPGGAEGGGAAPYEPMSTAGRLAMAEGKNTGVLWDPKDSVQARNIPTPNLDTNARQRDADMQRRHGGQSDLYYEVNHSLTEARVPATIIHQGRGR